MSDTARTDKWLWAVRLFKTRGLAAEMCAAGKVKRRGHALKAASALHAGDLLELPFPEGPGTRTVSVVGLIEQRVGAPEARACYEESTAAEVWSAREEWQQSRKDGLRGRPTKKNRRLIERHRGFFE
ncbi:MAG TPA: RNA-binding S4 domain-containing protein [Luteolibacter sp.]|nr:RNA-binding S4 domain-containing protein [Luteolibacter sp.]